MSSDKTVLFLLENDWSFNKNTGLFKHTLTNEQWVTSEAAIKIQEEISPKTVEDFRILSNLNNKFLDMYDEYLES